MTRLRNAVGVGDLDDPLVILRLRRRIFTMRAKRCNEVAFWANDVAFSIETEKWQDRGTVPLSLLKPKNGKTEEPSPCLTKYLEKKYTLC